MALGTPTDGGARYSAQNGTSVLAAYPASIVAGDCLVLVVGQKPSTANGGTVTTPTGWTLQTDNLAAGGYGTTLGADTGNTNLQFYTKDVVDGTETGTFTVTIGQNNISWTLVVRVPTSGGTLSYQIGEGSRTTAPTSSLSVDLSSASISAQAGDKFISAMCIPTDATTPNQFTNAQTTITGLTVSNGELEEPDSGTGNDIGGFVGFSHVDSGTASGTATFTATLAGTLTNVRGPVSTLLIREAVVERTGSLAATETGTDAFSASGSVIVEGSLIVAEVGNDTFSATGSVTDQAITGSLAAIETGNDTFTSSGTVFVEGSLAATEVGADSFTASGKVIVEGSLAVTEQGADTFSATGTVDSNTVSGSLAATEVGNDQFSASGLVLIYGALSANEAGNDTFTSSGDVVVSGSFSVTEASDTLGSYVVDDYVDEGYTKDGWEGLVLIQGGLSASEVGNDIFSANGTEQQPTTGITGGGIRRSKILEAAQWILDLLDKDTVKQTERIKKVKARLKKVKKPEDLEDLQPIVSAAIVEVQSQKKITEDLTRLNLIIKELKIIKNQLDDEEEALLMLMA